MGAKLSPDWLWTDGGTTAVDLAGRESVWGLGGPLTDESESCES